MKKFIAKELNMRGNNIRFIGDPHLGRKFENGVPLDRRGQRETWQMETFNEQLIGEGYDAIIIVGDLFDKFRVSNEVLMSTAKLLIQRALVYSNTDYYVLKGNHDLCRDKSLVSSFDLLKHTVDLAEISNLHIVDEINPFTLAYKSKDVIEMLLVPYDAELTGSKVIQQFTIENPSSEFHLVVGHWDLEMIAGKIPHNLIPTEELKRITNLAVTGHYHQERWYPIRENDSNLQALCTGSMQPYAHGEDPTNDLDPLYVTSLLAEVEKNLIENPDYYKWKCVRVELKPDEELPSFNALQITKRFIGREESDEKSLDVSLEDFNVVNLMEKSLFDQGVSEETSQEIISIYNEKLNLSIGE